MKPGLLVASPRLDDTEFERTIILLCDYNEEGAMGLVINRGLELSLGQVMEQLDIEHVKDFSESVLWGGPVEPGAGLVIFEKSGDLSPETCLAQVEGTNLCVSASRVVLEAIGGGTWRGPYHLCLGYAGWAPGQLDREIGEGSWLVSDFNAQLLRLPIVDRWSSTLESFGVGKTLMWIPPIEA